MLYAPTNIRPGAPDLPVITGDASVKDNGGTILVGPMDVPGAHRIAQCLDAIGGPFALHQVMAA